MNISPFRTETIFERNRNEKDKKTKKNNKKAKQTFAKLKSKRKKK